MTTESIIGIVGSIVGILAAGVPFTKWAYNKYRKKSLKELMDNLMEKNLHKEDRQNVLRKMNKWLIGNRIKDSYIQKFELNKRGREDVFKDICIENGIYPTEEICNKFLGYDYQKARTEYNSKMASDTAPKEELSFAPSLGNDGSTVFMSDLLPQRSQRAWHRVMFLDGAKIDIYFDTSKYLPYFLAICKIFAPFAK